jgi:hypothetical protein
MKQQDKSFNQYSEKEITDISREDDHPQNKLERNSNSQSTSIDNNKKPSFWIRLFKAYSRFYDRIKPVLIVLWIAVFLLILVPIIGEFIIARSLSKTQELPNPQEHSEIIFDELKKTKVLFASQILDQSEIDRNQRIINTELLNALDHAHEKAETRAKYKIDSWIENLMFRVDHNFFDWYFNFFNKKWREDSALITWIKGEDVKQRYGETFEKEFSKRVVSQTEAEEKIEQIANNAVETYVNELEYKIARIGFEYNIPQTKWNQYLDSITFNIPGTGNTTLAEITTIGAYPLAKALVIPTLKGVSIVGVEKIATVAGVKYATKLGLKGAAETAIGTLAKVADPLVLIGFVWWEVHDHQTTVEKQKPALHESIFESFKEIEDDILHDPNSGIMTTLYHIENSIRDSISLTSNSDKNVSIPTI